MKTEGRSPIRLLAGAALALLACPAPLKVILETILASMRITVDRAGP